MNEVKKFRSGFVTIVGRPNVGKSTLMNALVGEKVAIVSNRPQTTRNRIMGVMTRDDWQMVFLDTPGIHTPRTKLGNYMMQSVREAMDGMDGMMVLVDATAVGEHDRSIVKEMASKNYRLNLTDRSLLSIQHTDGRIYRLLERNTWCHRMQLRMLRVALLLFKKLHCKNYQFLYRLMVG